MAPNLFGGGRMKFIYLLIVLSTFAAASPNETSVQSAFSRLQSLSGDWRFVEENQTYVAHFESVADGHTLMERNAYVGMYALDGDSLLLTLFTKDGNQPRLRA